MTQYIEKSREIKQATHLLSESPMLVYPSLAKLLGINKAVILQQLHFLLNGQKTSKNQYNHINGLWWVYNSYQQWRADYFVWLSEGAIKRLFLELEEAKLVLTMQSVKNASDRRKWYTIDYAAWEHFVTTTVTKCDDQPSEQIETMVVTKCDDGYSESTSESTDKKTVRNERARDPIFDLVALHSFQIQPGQPIPAPALIAKISSWLKGSAKVKGLAPIGTPATAEQVKAFYVWYGQKYKDADPPRDAAKFATHWQAFTRASAQPRSMIEGWTLLTAEDDDE